MKSYFGKPGGEIFATDETRIKHGWEIGSMETRSKGGCFFLGSLRQQGRNGEGYDRILGRTALGYGVRRAAKSHFFPLCPMKTAVCGFSEFYLMPGDVPRMKGCTREAKTNLHKMD
jgi:hypothetical protein